MLCPPSRDFCKPWLYERTRLRSGVEVVQPVVNVKPERPAEIPEKKPEEGDGFPMALVAEDDVAVFLKVTGGVW